MISRYITLQIDTSLSNVLSNLTKTSLDPGTMSRHTKLRHAEQKDWLGVYKETHPQGCPPQGGKDNKQHSNLEG